MFLEVKARAVNEKWIINLNNVAFIFPHEGGTRIYLVGDREPIDAEEDYETIKHRIGTYLQFGYPYSDGCENFERGEEE